MKRICTPYEDDITISYDGKGNIKAKSCARMKINEYTSIPYEVLLTVGNMQDLIIELQAVIEVMEGKKDGNS